MMDWIPVFLVTFKVLVFGTGMFFAIKWHYDQAKKEKAMEKRTLLLASAKVTAVFVLSLMLLLALTFVLGRMVGLDLSFP